jgi:hypothetical protein
MEMHGRKRTDKRQLFGAAVLLLALLLLPAAAQARVGGLDLGFGGDARVTAPGWLDDPVKPVFASDGSILLLQEGQVVRYRPDGVIDPAFGNGGQVVLPSHLEGLKFEPSSLAVDTQSRVIVFGAATDPERKFEEPEKLQSIAATWPVIMRLESDGDPDPSFGDGKGYVRSDFGMRAELETAIPLVRGVNGRVDSHDRPVFMVQVAGGFPVCGLGHEAFAWYPRAVVRLATAGTPDSGFGGGDGIAPIWGNSGESGLGLDAAGGLAAGVGTQNCRLAGNRIYRFDASGAPLANFGVQGSRAYPGLNLSLIEPSGALILDDPALRSRTIARTLLTGHLDPRFGAKGRVNVRMPFGTNRLVQPVGVDAQRRVVLVGSFELPKRVNRGPGKQLPPRKARPRPPRSFLAVGRLTASGKPDKSFGRRGWIITPVKGRRFIRANAALDPQGRLVAVISGVGSGGRPWSQPALIVRYLLQR